jgi:hypothetical protein
MALNAVLSSLDGVDDAIASLYVEKDGMFILDVAPVSGFSLENVVGLKSSLSKERENARQAATQLKGFDGLSAEEAKTAITKLAEINDWTPDDKIKELIESREKQLLGKHTNEMTAVSGQLTSVTTQLENQLIRNAAIEAITSHKGNVELLLPHIEKQTRMEMSGDKYSAVVVDENGAPRVSMQTGSVANMSIPELVESMKAIESYSPAFAGSGAAGSGAAGSSTGGGASGNHQLSWAEAKNPDAYRAAKSAAEKAGSDLEINSYEQG